MDMLVVCGQFVVYMIRFVYFTCFCLIIYLFKKKKLKIHWLITFRPFWIFHFVIGLERETCVWEDTIHELCGLQEEIRCRRIYCVCEEASRRYQEAKRGTIA